MSTRRDHPILEALGVVALFMALVAVAPGALLTFAAEHLLRLNLDVGQRWTWAIASNRFRLRDGLALAPRVGRAHPLHAVSHDSVGGGDGRAVRNARSVGRRDATGVRPAS